VRTRDAHEDAAQVVLGLLPQPLQAQRKHGPRPPLPLGSARSARPAWARPRLGRARRARRACRARRPRRWAADRRAPAGVRLSGARGSRPGEALSRSAATCRPRGPRGRGAGRCCTCGSRARVRSRNRRGRCGAAGSHRAAASCLRRAGGASVRACRRGADPALNCRSTLVRRAAALSSAVCAGGGVVFAGGRGGRRGRRRAAGLCRLCSSAARALARRGMHLLAPAALLGAALQRGACSMLQAAPVGAQHELGMVQSAGAGARAPVRAGGQAPGGVGQACRWRDMASGTRAGE